VDLKPQQKLINNHSSGLTSARVQRYKLQFITNHSQWKLNQLSLHLEWTTKSIFIYIWAQTVHWHLHYLSRKCT